jgi:xanthine dehydrogenase accessory factor
MLQTIVKLIKSQENAVIATIIHTEGSTPRERGTKMLIKDNGQTIGTIGGGSTEYLICQKALSILATDDVGIQGEIYHIVIQQEAEVSELSVCGANMDVLLEVVREDNLWQVSLNLIMEGKDAVIVTSLVPPFTKSIWDSKGNLLFGQYQPEDVNFTEKIKKIYMSMHTDLIELNNELIWLIEPLVKTTRLLILGAGHVAREVAFYAKSLDFHVTVIDNRPDFALPEFFPGVYAVKCSDFSSGIKKYKIDCNTYVVIATWSHQTDEECLKNVLVTSAKYVGMLGSTKKVTTIRKKLSEAGYTIQNLARLKAPIGININAQTPSEIAISILAEIISVRRSVVHLKNRC